MYLLLEASQQQLALDSGLLGGLGAGVVGNSGAGGMRGRRSDSGRDPAELPGMGVALWVTVDQSHLDPCRAPQRWTRVQERS